MHMGDGGVACLPLQHIMDRFSASETLCGGNNGIVGTHFDSIKMDISQMQPMNESFPSSGDAFKSEFLSSNFHGVAENGTSCIPVLQTEEVEEGEFGTLKWPMVDTLNEDNISDRQPRSDIQNKCYAPGELLSGIVDKQDPSPGPSHNVTEKRSCSGIGQREELSKIDSRLDRRHCTENGNHEAEEQTCTRYGNSHDKIYFCQTLDGSRKNTKYSSELTDKLVHDNEQRNRSKNDQETGYENCTNHHHISKSESGGLKHQTGDNDFRSSKIRKLHDNSGQICTDRNIRHSEERSNGHANSSRISSHDKYSSRHRDSLSSRANHNRHGPRFPDRSPRNRTRHHDRRNRSPTRRDNSPYNRGFRNSNRRTRSPHMEKSPMSRVLHRDRSEYTPSFSPYNSSRQNGFDGRRNSLSGSKEQDEKQRQKDSRSKGKDDIFKQHDLSFKPLNINYCCKKRSHGIGDTTICSDLEKNKNDLSPRTKCGVPLQSCKYLEDQQPMEEDMDICVTPPHLSSASESTSGKWFYLDHHGMECGPLKLHYLKKFVKDGVLVSDHLVKHLDSDRWETIENAASPSLTLTASSVVSYSTTHIVSPPEAPGNLLLDLEDVVPPDSHKDTESGACFAAQPINSDDPTSETSEDLHIDERVEALVRHFSFLPGMELEILAEALGTNFDHTNIEKVWGHAEGFILNSTYTGGRLEQQVGDVFQHAENSIKDDHEGGLTSYLDRYLPQDYAEIAESFNCLWPCKGGDWVRNDAFMVDKCSRKKVVLNHGFPLCKMPVCLSDDPRWLCKDEIYLPSHRKLQLPPWAFCCPDEPNDLDLPRKSAQLKPSPIKGLKGSPLQLIRINACVVKDCANSSKEMNASKSERSSSCGLSDDLPRESMKFLPFSSFSNEQDLINIARDHIHTIDELQLHLGDWYYFDGIGQERGPFTFSFLHGLVKEGAIQNGSSVYRKCDKIWVPIGSAKWTSVVAIEKNSDEESGELFGISSRAVGYSSSNHDDSLSSLRDDSSSNQDCSPSSLLHSMHPQFLGFTRGKLHELVMKSYRSREFAAAINEVLDPWINAKQPKKEMEKHIISPGLIQKSQKADLDSDGEAMIFVGENVNGEEDPSFCKGDSTFDDLCSGTTFKEGNTYSGISMDSWGLLDGVVLARIFHFLRNEARSLIFASLTCKHWKSAVQFYKEMCRKIDLSSLGPHCSDEMIWTLLSDYNRDKVTSIVLVGCTSLSPNVMEKILCSFRCLLSLDIRGCNQLADLSIRFPDIYWIKHRKLYGPANSKLRNPDQELDSALSSFQKNCRNFPTDDFSELKDYFESVDKRDAAKHLFRKNLYKRSKLFDARKSSSILCRDARIRRWAIGKHENGYKRMEEFLTLSLKGIMRENTFDFFKLKVAEIEERVKNGFYAKRGLTYVMEDISRMCEEAMRERNHTSMNSTMASLMELVSCLEKRIVREHGMHYKKTMKRRQSEQNRRLRGTGSETSEDRYDFSDCGSVGSDRDVSIAELKQQEVAIVGGGREWGARMTEASLVPPVTRKYEFIEGYVIVVDEEDVRRKMSVSLPDDHAEKMSVIEQELDMEIPEVKEYRPRKKLGDEVIEQEVYGIDPYTHNLLLDSMPDEPDWPLYEKHLFIEDILLRTLNTQAMRFTGSGPPPPMTHSLRHVVGEIQRTASSDGNFRVSNMCVSLIDSMARRSDDEYVAYRKDDFVVEFLGEVYPAWKWFEKQDGIRSLQKDNSDPAPEFYNIYLERPKGDANGYDLVVVDAMHKANYASRICHSCRPNCEAKVTAVNGHYQIGIYTLHPIRHGEEITFDYNSVTESKEEYEASVCLCGSRVCRGSYLNLTGEGAFLKVLEQSHGLLDRVRLMVEACDARSVPEDDYIDLGKAGLGSCLLDGLPDWLIVYSARLVRFINFERMKLPDEILHHNVAEKRKFFVDVNLDVEKSDAELQAEGVYNQRLQNLAVTLDKVRYVMRCVFGDAKLAPPPLQRLSGDDVSCHLSDVERSLLDCITPHVEPSLLSRLTPPRSLLWLRDELRNLPCTYKCRHDAAADLIQLYAHTQSFYRVLEYGEITSPAVYISPLDLGPNHGATIGQEYRKTYGPNYCLGQLMFWYNQTCTFPDVNLVESGRGCLFLPEMGSFYARPDKPSRHLVYGPRTLRSVLTRMEKPWPEDGIWTFDSAKARVMGSPALDAAINHSVIDRNMVQWLRTRSTVFQTSWDK